MSSVAVGRISRRAWLRAAASLVGLLPGCEAFRLFDKPVSLAQQVNKLPAIPAPPDAMRFDIVFVERPLGDSLLGDKLWSGLDEVPGLENQKGDLLRQNGFRVGVSGSNPPQTLQTLLGLKSDFAYEPTAEKSKQLVGRQVVLRSGGETEVQASPLLDECTVEIRDGKNLVARNYQQCRGLLRVTAHRVQDGWAKLEFIPVVMHGRESTHFTAGEESWQYTNGQRTEAMFSQRFETTLAIGEMAVISADERTPGSLGQMFFSGKSHAASPQQHTGLPVQRALVVRLADMALNQNPYAPSK